MTPEAKAAVIKLAEEGADRFVTSVRAAQTIADLHDKLIAFQKENTLLRAIIATSDINCIYCGLPQLDMIKCQHGFPGCGRADDINSDPRPGISST